MTRCRSLRGTVLANNRFQADRLAEKQETRIDVVGLLRHVVGHGLRVEVVRQAGRLSRQIVADGGNKGAQFKQIAVDAILGRFALC